MSMSNQEQANNAPQQANLTLSNEEGLQHLLDKIDVAVCNIYNRRKTTSKYFREELFVAKTSNDFFAQWALDTKDNLVITPKAHIPVAGQNTLFGAQPNTGNHHKQEYDNTIRYAFKRPLANLKNTERAIKMAIRYKGQVEVSADILNNMDFFSNNAECTKKLDIYCKRSVDKFIKNNIPHEQQ